MTTTIGQNPEGLDIKPAAEFLQGFFKETSHKDHLSAIEHCISDGKSLISDVGHIKADFANKSFTNILNAITTIGEMVAGIKKDLDDCKEAVDDIKKVAAWMKSTLAQSGLITKIIGNQLEHGPEIKDKIDDINREFGEKHYESVGEHAAEIVIWSLGKIHSEAPEVMLY